MLLFIYVIDFTCYNCIMKKILRENRWYIISILLLLVIYIILFKSSFYDVILSFDNSVRKFVSNIIDDNLTLIFETITNYGDFYSPFAIIVCIFLINKNKWYSYVLGLGYAISGVIALIFKLIISRPRPLDALIRIPSSFSFPSGHTFTSIVFYLFLCYLLTLKSGKIKKIIFYSFFTFLTLIISISRIYLGVHYFSDVVGGIILAIPCLFMLINIASENFKERLL